MSSEEQRLAAAQGRIVELEEKLRIKSETLSAVDIWIKRELDPAIRQRWHPRRYKQIRMVYDRFLDDPRFLEIGPPLSYND